MSEHAGRRTWWWVLPVAVVVALFVWAGYGEGWAWTGLSRQVTLWDWLEGLALPFTVGLVPLLLRYRGQLATRHLATVVVALAAFAALVLCGYLVPWGWTGFTGNTLWDWLSLALLPLVIATSTFWRPPPRWTARHEAEAGAAPGAGQVVAEVGGGLGDGVPHGPLLPCSTRWDEEPRARASDTSTRTTQGRPLGRGRPCVTERFTERRASLG